MSVRSTIITEIAVELWTFIFGANGNVIYFNGFTKTFETVHVNIAGSPLLQAAFILGILGFICAIIYGIARALKLFNKKVLLGLIIGAISLFICVGVMFIFANNELLKGTANVIQQTSDDPITFEQALTLAKENLVMNVGNGPVVISVFSFITAGLFGSVLLVDKFKKD